MENFFKTIKAFFNAVYEFLTNLLKWKDDEVSDVSSALDALNTKDNAENA